MTIMRFRDGGVAIICGRGRSEPSSCVVCGKTPANRLCDQVVDQWGKTCDQPMCVDCTTPGPKWNTDLCPNHVPETVDATG